MKATRWIAALGLFATSAGGAEHVVDDSYSIARRFEGYRTQYPGIALPRIAPRTGQTLAFDLIYKTVGERDLHVDVFGPAAARTNHQGIVLVHGGAWRSGSKAHFYAIANLLSHRGFTVFLPEFRLTPEERYPAGMEDIADALLWVRKKAADYGLRADRIALGGASSGGQMAALLAYRGAPDGSGGVVRPSALIDMDGVLDATSPLALRYENAAGPASPFAKWLGGSFEQAPEAWRNASAAAYAGPASPPTLILSSGIARFTAGRETVTTALQRHGVRTDTFIYAKAPHDFWLFDPYLDQAVDRIATFLSAVDADARRKARTR